MAEYPNAPCEPWTDLATVRACYPDLVAPTFPDALLQDSIDSATQMLYMLSGQQFKGICQDTIRPCGELCCLCGSKKAFSCSCYGMQEVALGVWPIVEIVQVIEDGVVTPPTEYRVDDYRVLVRVSTPPEYTPDPWPTCQFMDRELTEPGTFGVEVRYGLRPPLPGQSAARDLASQFARACMSAECDLPTRAATVARRGITFQLNNLDELQATDFVGIPSVDLFLKTYNPNRLRVPSRVWSPDLPNAHRRTGT